MSHNGPPDNAKLTVGQFRHIWMIAEVPRAGASGTAIIQLSGGPITKM